MLCMKTLRADAVALFVLTLCAGSVCWLFVLALCADAVALFVCRLCVLCCFSLYMCFWYPLTLLKLVVTKDSAYEILNVKFTNTYLSIPQHEKVTTFSPLHVRVSSKSSIPHCCIKVEFNPNFDEPIPNTIATPAL